MSKNTLGTFVKRSPDISSMTLTAVALQDHWSHTLGLGSHNSPKKIGLGPAARAKQKPDTKTAIDTGLKKTKPVTKKNQNEEQEYTLDQTPPPLTLAQKYGLVNAPKQLLSEHEWKNIKTKSNNRNDSNEPCVICKEDFGLQDQVLLSCTHVFHKACLQAFERFTGKKTCPMCRHEQYQTRVIYEGARFHKHKCATKIQSLWRGYVVRTWYKQLRQTVPPKDPKLRKKFFEEKMSAIVDRMIKSVDFNMSEFLREIDKSIEQSRAACSMWDAAHQDISSQQWDAIQLKAIERGDTDCPICLTELQLSVDCLDEKVQNCKVNLSSSNRQHSNKKRQDKNLPEELSKKTLPLVADYNFLADIESKHEQAEMTRISDAASKLPMKHSETASVNFRPMRHTALLSCSHVFHSTCLKTLEEIAMADIGSTCPVCRAHYQKKILEF